MPSLPLLLEVLPLALGAAVSPLVLILQVLILGRSPRSLAPSWGFALGAALVVAGWSAAGLLLGHALPPRPQGPDPLAAAIHLALALVLLLLGLLLFSGRLRRPTPPAAPPGARGGLLLGVGCMASNLTSLVLFLPALQDLARARLAPLQEALLVVLLGGITLAPALLPPALVGLCGSRGRRVLERLSPWLAQHQSRIQAILCFVFAGFLGWRGVLER